LDWDAANLGHIARDRVTPGEVEQVFANAPVMPKKKIVIPKFRSEQREAEWWDAQPAVATRLLKQALKRGAVQRRPGETRIVTMRIPVRDLESAQHLAERKGLPYQTCMKMLLHQALEKERAAG